jgi:hypothetical protein
VLCARLVHLTCLLFGCRLLFGYAMPALECFKSIEQRPGRTDLLRFCTCKGGCSAMSLRRKDLLLHMVRLD